MEKEISTTLKIFTLIINWFKIFEKNINHMKLLINLSNYQNSQR